MTQNGVVGTTARVVVPVRATAGFNPISRAASLATTITRAVATPVTGALTAGACKLQGVGRSLSTMGRSSGDFGGCLSATAPAVNEALAPDFTDPQAAAESAAGALMPWSRLGRLRHLEDVPGGRSGHGRTPIPLSAFTDTTIDGVIASAGRLGRGGRLQEGARALDKKAGHARRAGIASAFEGIAPRQAEADRLIRNVMSNPTIVDRGDRVVDAYNAAGQGIRYRRDTGAFQGFLELQLRRPR